MQILCKLYWTVQTGKGRADKAMRGINFQMLQQTDISWYMLYSSRRRKVNLCCMSDVCNVIEEIQQERQHTHTHTSQCISVYTHMQLLSKLLVQWSAMQLDKIDIYVTWCVPKTCYCIGSKSVMLLPVCVCVCVRERTVSMAWFLQDCMTQILFEKASPVVTKPIS